MKRISPGVAPCLGIGLFAFFLLFSVLFASVLPVYTNDGPAHLGIANFFAHAVEGSLATDLYRSNDMLIPNVATYLLLTPLLKFVSTDHAESIVQLIAVLGPPLAAYFAIAQIRYDRAWLAILILPLSFNQCFFLGLYNFCFSIVAFFLTLGAYFWMLRSDTSKRVLLPIAMLYLAFFAHAAGFIASLVSIASLGLVRAGLELRTHRIWGKVILSLKREILMAASLTPLALLMLASNTKGPMIYGTGLQERLLDLATLRILEVNAPSDAKIGLMLNLVLIGGVAWGIVRLWFARAALSEEIAGLAGAVALVAALILQALLFPDVMGGGWTHFLRMCLFPALAAPLCFAYLPLGSKTKAVVAIVGVGASISLLASTVDTQAKVKEELVHLEAIDQIVGRHCAVLPVILEKRPQNQHMRYSPFFHVATRLEHRYDRVALFNFIVRLDVYPLQYREKRNVQELLFDWQPAQQRTAIEHLSVDRFEAQSGIPVDYLLRWGHGDLAKMPLKTDIANIASVSTLVYESADRRIQLYRRPINPRSRCTT
jgi:hypothetical protein